uniref:Uncharacterized protein n=1 Tax=Romanomermis culicivorax TaxID=13658 RepID=A0A915J902_ROMCU
MVARAVNGSTMKNLTMCFRQVATTKNNNVDKKTKNKITNFGYESTKSTTCLHYRIYDYRVTKLTTWISKDVIILVRSNEIMQSMAEIVQKLRTEQRTKMMRK